MYKNLLINAQIWPFSENWRKNKIEYLITKIEKLNNYEIDDYNFDDIWGEIIALMAIIFQNNSLELIIQFTINFSKMLANIYIKKLEKEEENFDMNKKITSYMMPYYRMFAGILATIFNINND